MRRLVKSIFLISLFLFLCSTFVFAAEEITITTYYPSPYGVYNTMRLYPQAGFAAGAACTNLGEMVYDSAGNQLLGCAGSTPVWQALGGGGWMDSGTVVSLTTSTDNVGIGTAAPNAKLEVSGGSQSATIRVSSTDLGDETVGFEFGGMSLSKGGLFYSERSDNKSFLLINGIEAVTILDNGNVGIGRIPATYSLEVEGNASKSAVGAWLANSDQRIKTDIHGIDNAVDTLGLLRPVKFRYTDEYKAQHPTITDKYYYNFIAQEFQQVFPAEVTVTNDALPNGEHILAIDPYVVTPYLVKAIQEQQDIIKAQQREIDELKVRLDKLEGK